jgi:dihydropteroate synthase
MPFNAYKPTEYKSKSMVCRGREFVWGRRTYVMGIINLTPDSFSGDGLGGRPEAAAEQASAFEEAGADILDLGAESTRPGHRAVPEEEELQRLMPSLEAVLSKVKLPVSVDTYKSGVAKRALEAGASMVNDVWGFKADPKMAFAAAEAGVPVALMHNQSHTRYRDLVSDVVASLRESVEAALEAGISPYNIIIDPGIGFGKTADHNLEILGWLPEFKSLGYPLLVGTSRKSTIGLVLDLPVEERLEGTAATVALSIAGGADIVRVHDVKSMVRVARMSDAIVRGWRPAKWSR